MRHSFNINGKIVAAQAGETLVDAALMEKVLIPHDCASGQCETCRVRVAWGEVDDAGTAYGDTVLACRARITGDATITFEEAPPPETVSGVVESITPLCDDVLELTVQTDKSMAHRPGQYAKLRPRGFPSRDYSFSAKMDGSWESDKSVFQIRRFPNGRVSSALGKAITPGHKVRLSGPFGSAFLREQETGPLVLASSGTGFAPIWSLARAVKLAQPNRPLSIVTGVRRLEDVYMMPAFRWLQQHGHESIVVTSRRGARGPFLAGTPDQHMPPLDSQSVVHVAGNPALVERIREQALCVSAKCHADPFTANAAKPRLLDRFRPVSGLLSVR